MDSPDLPILPPTTEKLGKFIEAIDVKPQGRRQFLLVALAWFLGAAGVYIYPFILKSIPNALGPGDLYPLRQTTGMWAVVFLAFGLVFLAVYLFKRNHFVAVFELGLFCRSSLSSVICRWDQISEVYYSTARWRRHDRLRYTYRFVTNNGKYITISEHGVPNGKEISQRIQSKVLDVQWPKAIDALNKAQAVICHPFIVRKDGIFIHRKLLRWEELSGMETEKWSHHINLICGSKVVRTKRPTSSVANLELLRLLIARFASKNRF